MTRPPLPCALLCSLALVGCAQASSPNAWHAHEQRVISHCLQASQLTQSRPMGRPIDYPDALGITAVLLGGHYPQAHMQGRAGTELCLFDRKAEKAFVQDADDFTGR